MEIEFDSRKRDQTLRERGLDFARFCELFNGKHLTRADSRAGYDEPRFQTIGRLDGHMVMAVWTPRGAARRVISMRRINEREISLVKADLD